MAGRAGPTPRVSPPCRSRPFRAPPRCCSSRRRWRPRRSRRLPSRRPPRTPLPAPAERPRAPCASPALPRGSMARWTTRCGDRRRRSPTSCRRSRSRARRRASATEVRTPLRRRGAVRRRAPAPRRSDGDPHVRHAARRRERRRGVHRLARHVPRPAHRVQLLGLVGRRARRRLPLAGQRGQRARAAVRSRLERARARRRATGWTAEMRIPFSQLRFNARARADVGHAAHAQRRRPERARAVGADPRVGRGLRVALRTPRRHRGHPAGAPPRAAAVRRDRTSTYRANVDPANPFNDRGGARAGGDLKVGLGPNLTLDATINPDFGQVEADPAVVNLTAFEIVFEERRPFFIEGNELLTGRGQSFIGRPSWFYSRRIGAAPRGIARGDFVDAPTNTTILSAAKVTGRLASGLSVGALAAVTPREYARTFDVANDSLGRVAVEPPSAFGVLRLQQEFGRSSRTSASRSRRCTVRSTTRGGLDAAAAARAPSPAAPTGSCATRQGMYEVTGWVGGSHVARRRGGDRAAAALERALLPAPRPDARRRSTRRARRSRASPPRSASTRTPAASRSAASSSRRARPSFDINDAGQMRSGDDIDFNADIQLRDTKPNRYVRFFNFGTSTQAGWNFGGIRQYLRFSEIGPGDAAQLLALSARGTLHVASLSDDLTRGGPLIGTPSATQLTAQRRRAAPNVPTTWTARTDVLRRRVRRLAVGRERRPHRAARVAVAGVGRSDVLATRSTAASTSPRAPAAAPRRIGQRYIFSFIERSTLSARFRLNYAFTPNFTAEGYAEPFAASGRFYDFGELPARAEPHAAHLWRERAGHDDHAGTPSGTSDGTRCAARRSRFPRSTSTGCRSGRTSCCAGSGCRAARRS